MNNLISKLTSTCLSLFNQTIKSMCEMILKS